MNPIDLFEQHYRKVEGRLDDEGLNGMCLSTVDAQGLPHSRMVLFRGILNGKFSFYTNLRSNKAKEIECRSRVSLLFYWRETKIQIRIEGIAHPTPREDVIRYWNQRPFDSRVSGSISEQSQPISSFEELVRKFENFKQHVTDLVCPEHWGGFLVEPTYYEFWEGSAFRLHKRQIFQFIDGQWVTKFLQP
jgi:pyridoxamine 5'-phosphate oxidase